MPHFVFRSRPATIVLLAFVLAAASACVSQGTSAADNEERPRRTPQPPRDQHELWQRTLLLLRDRASSITPERVENVLGVHFGTLETQVDATAHLVRPREDAPFAANLTVYDASYRAVGDVDGAHVSWVLLWKDAWPGATQPGECVTAGQAQADLLALGWGKPWREWGFMEEQAKRAAAQPPLTGGPELHRGGLPPPLAAGFGFGWGPENDQLERLPRGRLYSTGDLAESCVIGINMVTRP